MLRITRSRARVISILSAFLLLVVSTAFATGVATVDTEPSSARRTVTDATGRDVEIPANPQRIVVAGNATLMVADALYLFESAPERIVGITRISQARGNFLPEIDPGYGEKAVLERNVGPEQVASLNPDLVILKSFMKQRLGDGVERLGIPVVYVDLETPEQYQRDLRLFGEILQEEGRAQVMTSYYSDVVDAVSRRTTSLPARERPTTLLVYANPTGGDVAFNVPPAGWIQTTLVETAGGGAIWKESNPGGGWLTVGFEQVAAWDPDKIFFVSYRANPDDLRDQLLQQDRWQALTAVRNGEFHVFPVDFYSWDQPDTRWAIGLQWLATKMHPELFSDLEIEQIVVQFFGLAYGMDADEVQRVILDPIWGDLN